MTSCAAVGVYDDLPSGQTAVALRTAYHETSGGVDEILSVFVQQFCRDHSRDHIVHHVTANGLQSHICSVLGGDDNCIHTNRLVPIVFHGDLCLAVRAEISQCLILSQFCQLFAQLMGQRNCQRHQFRRLIAGITKHHALVAGAGLGSLAASGFDRIVYTHCNIRGLLVDRLEHRTGIAVKAVLCSVIADVHDHVPCDLLDVHLGRGGDLTHAQHHAGSDCSFAGNTCLAVLFQDSVQHCVRDLVADLVRMSFCYGFGCKKSSCHSICSFLSRGNSIKKRHPRRVSKTFCTNPSSLGYTAGIGTVCDKNVNRLPGFTGPVPPPLLIRYKVCRQHRTKYAALLLFYYT